MTENHFEAAVRITHKDGATHHVRQTSNTLADARKKAALHGVGYFLYDNKHVTGKDAAMRAAQAKDHLVENGRVDIAGFTFELVDLEAA